MKIVIISDIHEDIVSLKLAFQKIDKIKPHKIVCLGDISGFSVPYYLHQNTRNAHSCLDIIRESCNIVLLGNHDLNAIKKLPDYSIDFDFPDNWYDLDYHEKKSIANDNLWLYEENELNPMYTKDDIDWLSACEEMSTIRDGAANILFTHYAFPNISGMTKSFYNTPNELKNHFKLMEKQKCNLSIVGHAHAKGLLYYTKNNIFDSGYKKRKLPKQDVCIITPSITSSGVVNGFLCVDTDKMEVEAIRI